MDKDNGNEKAERRPLFSLGQIFATPGALAALQTTGQHPFEFLHRHVTGDFGDLVEEDQRANRRALEDGGRIFSAYNTVRGERIWIITEATLDDDEDPTVRQVTTILTPLEY